MNTRWAHSARAITMNSKWMYNNSILQIKYYPVKSYYQEKRRIILLTITPRWASILSLLLKPESCIFPSATHNMNKNILSISLGRFMPLQQRLQCRSNSYVGEICSPLMTVSKLPQIITEPGVPLRLLQLFLRTRRSLVSCTLGSPTTNSDVSHVPVSPRALYSSPFSADGTGLQSASGISQSVCLRIRSVWLSSVSLLELLHWD